MSEKTIFSATKRAESQWLGILCMNFGENVRNFEKEKSRESIENTSLSVSPKTESKRLGILVRNFEVYDITKGHTQMGLELYIILGYNLSISYATFRNVL